MSAAASQEGKGGKLKGASKTEGANVRRNSGEPAAMSRDPKEKGGGRMEDTRFAAMHSDPRFRRFPKNATKVEIDSRFAGMFTDKSFQVRGALDKRGRRVDRSKSKEDMRRYYRLEDQEEEEAEMLNKDADTVGKMGHASHRARKELEEAMVKKTMRTTRKQIKGLKSEPKKRDKYHDNNADGEDDLEGDQDHAQQLYLRARGLAGPDSSSDEESSDDDEDGYEEIAADDDAGSDEEDGQNHEEEEEEEEEEEDKELTEMKRHFGIGALAGLDPEHQDIQLVEDATRRLALVDLNWAHIQAVDILAMLRSFCGTSGRVERVTVYPSDYGLERMRNEAVAGPQAIFQGTTKKVEEEEDGEDSGDEVDKTRLRYYERSRLRYYYAVAEFDSARTASRIYGECDGLEFEHSSCRLDLRFVPDIMDLSSRQVRDTADSVPADYDSPVFFTNALAHSNVKLTWDADDTKRKKMLQKAVATDDLKEDDIKAFLASDDSEEEEGEAGEDAEKLRERYRSLLGLGAPSGSAGRGGTKGWQGEDAEDQDFGENGKKKDGNSRTLERDRDMEMEVTFSPSLEDLGERLKAKQADSKGRGGDTVWDAYLRKQKEKRMQRKAQNQRGVESEDEGDEDAVASDLDDGLYIKPGQDVADPFFEGEGDPFSDPFFQGDRENRQAAAGKPEAKSKKAGGKKEGRKEDVQEHKVNKAELEMLLMDDSALLAATRGVRPSKEATETTGGADRERLSRKERIRRKKEARLKARRDDSDDEDLGGFNGGASDTFKVDLQDPRFKALVTDPRFALDPTDPEFRRGPGAAQLAQEISKIRSNGKETAQRPGGDLLHGKIPNLPEGGGSSSVKVMVANLKRKAGKFSNKGTGGSKQRKA